MIHANKMVDEYKIPTITWDDVIGLERVKADVQEILHCPQEHQDKFLKFGVDPWRGLLLFGPPGCGKTLLAKAIANEHQAKFIPYNCQELLRLWSDKQDHEYNIREIFDQARLVSPCVIYFDDFDYISRYSKLSKDTSDEDTRVSDRSVNQLLTELDGLRRVHNVIVIGATSRPQIIDSPLIKPGRLDMHIYIPLPDEETRLGILKAKLKDFLLAKDIDLVALVKASAGFSGADVVQICDRACKEALKQKTSNNDSMVEDDQRFEIRWSHFEKFLNLARLSMNQNDSLIKEYEKFDQRTNFYFGSSFRFSTACDSQNRSCDYSDDDEDLYN